MTHTDTGGPPLIPGKSANYPKPGTRIGKAWADMWAILGDDEFFTDGMKLAEAVAPAHGLQPVTLKHLLIRAANAGLLDREYRDVKVPRAGREGAERRRRAFYRIRGGA